MFKQDLWDVSLGGCFQGSIKCFVSLDNDFQTAWEESIDLIHCEQRI